MTTVTVEHPRRYELPLFVVLAFAISWAMHIPLALATLRSGDALLGRSYTVAVATTPTSSPTSQDS